ncbi:APC family permease [Candidatus Finniella inopinata]|uniref:Arginine/agmatine antiporter n=1 Tax=Candidatus Finniella inopinata TaxID=1696036 RepID=A0A4Q7DIF8_9PROT|nr:amino acid permease [Candidatus Finniella inopinata]RZI46751.1 amino acid permease [Candidatus Finniella inopinata]
MSRKIGFWSVFALVTGSQIGSGVFTLPALLAPYGAFSMAGWVIAGAGAVALALVFGGLCSQFPRTGGPHVYAQQAFGADAAFFTGWTYWVISWVSTTAVIVASIGYLSPLIGNQSAEVNLLLEIALLLAITGLNLKGVQAAGHAEFLLTLLKFGILLVIPIVALTHFNPNNLVMMPEMSAQSTPQLLSQVALLTLWGFIGLESATAPAGCVKDACKTIPRAIIFGTLCVAALYIINSVGIMGLIPAAELAQSKAPYVDAAERIFGGGWHLVISIMASIACIGTLNAWMLASGQVALGLAEDGLLPRFFGRKNIHEAPHNGLLTSCVGIIPLLVLTCSHSLNHQITAIIDFSVVAFLFVYLMCGLAHVKVLRKQACCSVYKWVYTCVAIGFCLWVLYETPLKTLIIASLFVISGVPAYALWYKRQLRRA